MLTAASATARSTERRVSSDGPRRVRSRQAARVPWRGRRLSMLVLLDGDNRHAATAQEQREAETNLPESDDDDVVRLWHGAVTGQAGRRRPIGRSTGRRECRREESAISMLPEMTSLNHCGPSCTSWPDRRSQASSRRRRKRRTSLVQHQRCRNRLEDQDPSRPTAPKKRSAALRSNGSRSALTARVPVRCALPVARPPGRRRPRSATRRDRRLRRAPPRGRHRDTGQPATGDDVGERCDRAIADYLL